MLSNDICFGGSSTFCNHSTTIQHYTMYKYKKYLQLVLPHKSGNNKDILTISRTEITKRMLNLISKKISTISNFLGKKELRVKKFRLYHTLRIILNSKLHRHLTTSELRHHKVVCTAVADKFILIWFTHFLRTCQVCQPIISQHCIGNSALCNTCIPTWSVCLYVHMSVTFMHPAKTIGWNEMPFGRDTALDRGTSCLIKTGDLPERNH